MAVPAAAPVSPSEVDSRHDDGLNDFEDGEEDEGDDSEDDEDEDEALGRLMGWTR